MGSGSPLHCNGGLAWLLSSLLHRMQSSGTRRRPSAGAAGRGSAPQQYRALVLFDIDGTLVRRAGPHHRQALVDAVRAVTGTETTTEGIPVQGMLDPDILTVMMVTAGMAPPEIRRAMPEIIERAQEL